MLPEGEIVFLFLEIVLFDLKVSYFVVKPLYNCCSYEDVDCTQSCMIHQDSR